MLKIKVNKLFEFITSSDSTCECCGTPCRTALCEDCREDLLEMIDNSENSFEDAQKTVAQTQDQQLSA